VYGAIWAMGIGEYPDAISPTARMMTRAQFEDFYSNCAACYAGKHNHLSAQRHAANLISEIRDELVRLSHLEQHEQPGR
jgi:hypothetical protein